MGGIRRILKSEPICKTKYSMVGAECVRAQMAANSRRTTVILAGMETHIAINQTCIDLLARKYKVSGRQKLVDNRRLVVGARG